MIKEIARHSLAIMWIWN